MLRRSSNRIFSGVFNQKKNVISYATVRKIQTNSAEDGFIIKSTKENFVVPNTTIDQYVFNNFKEFESKTAIVSTLKIKTNNLINQLFINRYVV